MRFGPDRLDSPDSSKECLSDQENYIEKVEGWSADEGEVD